MYIKIKVTPGSKKEVINKISDDTYQISVKEKAHMNMANKRVLDIFRSLYPGCQIKIINGHRSPQKIISINID